MVDDQPTFILEDGSIIEKEQIGFIHHSYGEHPDDSFYEKFTKNDINFIINNNIECAIEMVAEDDDEESDAFEGRRVPRLYKNKVIIHFK